ncbi:MAG TPA: ChbG/HpnK family deacetylase [Thermoleophilaceae bacterium]|jgi:predicted glycoside hydrolase/deacetylase ChbG (UPF0249 family)
MSAGAGQPAGLLIVNADDYGIDRPTTDAILASFESGGITSTTAMVWMRDSERAAGRFPAEQRGLGLHLNLIEPYSGDAPADARERQARLAAYFRRYPVVEWIYNPLIARTADRCVADQLEAFRQLYGREPSHVDGHQHFHICPNVVVSRSLGAVPKLRPGLTFAQKEKPLVNRAYRAVLNALIRRRFLTPGRFLSLRYLVPELGGTGCARVREAERVTTEVMTHPGWEDEFRYLRSDGWRAQLEGLTLGSYAEL